MSPAVSGGGYHHAQRGGKLAASKGEGFDANGALFTGKQSLTGRVRNRNVDITKKIVVSTQYRWGG